MVNLGPLSEMNVVDWPAKLATSQPHGNLMRRILGEDSGKAFGDLLRWIREQSNLSLDDVAEVAGGSKATYSRFENDRRPLSAAKRAETLFYYVVAARKAARGTESVEHVIQEILAADLQPLSEQAARWLQRPTESAVDLSNRVRELEAELAVAENFLRMILSTARDIRVALNAEGDASKTSLAAGLFNQIDAIGRRSEQEQLRLAALVRASTQTLGANIHSDDLYPIDPDRL